MDRIEPQHQPAVECIVGPQIKREMTRDVLPNCTELFETYWAAAKMGPWCGPVQYDAARTGHEIAVADSDTVLITNSKFVDPINAIRAELPRQ